MQKLTSILPNPPKPSQTIATKFAKLCEAKEVREIVGLAQTPLTVFAPLDESLPFELASLGKSKWRSLSLVEFARHHIGEYQSASQATSELAAQSFALLSSSDVRVGLYRTA